MHTRHRFHVFCGSLTALAAPLLSVAADSAAPTPVANNAITVPYRAEQPIENFASDETKVTMEYLADGTRVYHANGQGMQSITAQIGSDGKLNLQCTDAADKAVQASRVAENVHEQ